MTTEMFVTDIIFFKLFFYDKKNKKLYIYTLNVDFFHFHFLNDNIQYFTLR